MNFGIDFDQIEDIAKTFEALSKLSEKEGKKDEMAEKLGSFQEMWGGFEISKNKLIRKKIDADNEEFKELTKNEDALGMMELFFGNTKYITEYHFPWRQTFGAFTANCHLFTPNRKLVSRNKSQTVH